MSDDAPATLRMSGVDYSAVTTVYAVKGASVFHADHNCPKLRGAALVRARSFPRILRTWGDPRRPCPFCTLDLADTVRVAVEHDGLSPVLVKTGRDEARDAGVIA